MNSITTTIEADFNQSLTPVGKGPVGEAPVGEAPVGEAPIAIRSNNLNCHPS